jgi:putative FmdB family regulatory protein
MPTYDYRCAACGDRFEVVHGVHSLGPEACPTCGATGVRKAIAAPAVHFKGSGWAKKERASSTAAKVAADSKAGAEGTSGADGQAPTSGDGSAGETPAAAVAGATSSAAATAGMSGTSTGSPGS